MGMAADATGPFDGQVWMFAMTRKLLYYIFVLRVSLICNPPRPPQVGGTIAIGRRRRRWSKLCYSLFFSLFLFCFYFTRWTTLPCCERWAELTVALGSSSSSSIAWLAASCRSHQLPCDSRPLSLCPTLSAPWCESWRYMFLCKSP